MVDANAILATRVPNHDADDRVVWSSSIDGNYKVKAGYKFWHDRNIGYSAIPQSKGWHRIWKLTIPYKFKIFLWRFCRNNLPVRVRLKGKGVPVPIMCPMCNVEIEHLRHVFFECEFALSCWHSAELTLDTTNLYEADVWLLDKLETTSQSDSTKVCTVLYGIWYGRNKRVWENKVMSGETVMDICSKMLQDWKNANAKRVVEVPDHSQFTLGVLRRWQVPESGEYKLNVDASWTKGADICSVGMVLRDSRGHFIEGRTMSFTQAGDVLEAEALGIREALSWVKNMGELKVTVESDSLVAVNVINGKNNYLLEVGHIIDHCRSLLRVLPSVRLNFIRKQANEVAHGLAKMPCDINCLVTFTSLPTHLDEICNFEMI
ncbi:uncharacterized protein LOC141664750 [Apium graveolens]|uniref:uncharacterized protein LOC141664750 n=1 Tax=Apium graveolens TaxID=4045 RepID=UPI003D790918